MKYFCLHNHFILNHNVLYDLLNGVTYELDKTYVDIINDYFNQMTNEEIINKYSADSNNKFREFVFLKKIGYFTDQFAVTEPITTCNKHKISMLKVMPITIDQITIELTSKCNINCIFCEENLSFYRSCGCKKWLETSILKDQEWIDLSNDIIKINPNTVVFSGGEPLLRKDLIISLIDKFYHENIKCIVYTNGELIDEDLFVFFKKRNVTVFIQISALENVLYRRITSSKNNINELFKNIVSFNAQDGQVFILLLVCKENENSIPSIEDSLKKNDLKYQKAFLYPNNSHYSIRYYSESISWKEKQKLVINLNNYNYYSFFSTCLSNSFFISSEGSVYPCMMLRGFLLGNTRNNKLYEILRDGGLRKYWELSQCRIEECRNCGYNIKCQDCRAIESINGLYHTKYCNKI